MTAAKRASGGKPAKPQVQRRLFVLDTNVLMHDPTAIFRFEEHDIYLPMVVLEELDANKKGLSEAVAQRAPGQPLPRRPDARCRPRTQIDDGLPLPSRTASAHRRATTTATSPAPPGGCSSRPASSPPPCRDDLPGHGADNAILVADAGAAGANPRVTRHAGVEGHQPAHQGRRGRRARRGLLQRQDHRRRRCAVHRHRARCRRISGRATARTCARGRKRSAPITRSHGPAVARLARQPVRVRGHARRASRPSCGASMATRRRSSWCATIARERHSVWGVHARNREQNFALNLLHGSRDRLRHHPRPGRHRQDAADARRRPHADARDQPLRRDHHDARDDSARRGHRLPAGHRRGKDGAVDGRAHGQPRGAHAERAKAATGDARPPTTCCATASRSAR